MNRHRESRMRIAARTALCVMMLLAWPAPSWSAPPGWPASLTIGTASPGGLYLVYGGGLAPILSEALGIPVTAQATQGPDQNVLLMERGDAQLGFVTMGVALQAWNGTGDWTHGKQFRTMRALFPMFDTPIQFITDRDAEMKSLADLAGKRIGVGPQGGTSGTYMPLIFGALNVATTARYGSWETLEGQLRSHLIDAIAVSVGVPTPFIAKIDAEQPFHFIAPTADEIATLRNAMPELGISTVAAGTYPSLKSDYKTVGLFNFAVASKDLPDDLVYEIVKTFYANHDRMVAVHPAARESVVANLKRDEFLPYHPGAVRYYREIGVEVPAGLVPPN
jgi:TRAP transporter TAXI family solute receptor